MLTADIMTQEVVSIPPTASVGEAVALMLRHAISGLPVITADGDLVGMITEGDLLRRAELGTKRHRPRWVEFLLGPGYFANEYIHTHSRRVSDLMTREVVTVVEDTSLEEAVRLMERYKVKRLPVVRGPLVVGILSRANLLRALASLKLPEPSRADDASIRQRLLSELKTHLNGVGRCDVVVKDGVVHLWGTVHGNRDAIRVAAENIPGVTEVRDNLVWFEPYSGIMIEADPAARVTHPPQSEPAP